MFTTTRFDGWDLPQDLLDGLSEAGFEHATAVQKDTIPIARIGTDLIGQARTGSGEDHRLRLTSPGIRHTHRQ